MKQILGLISTMVLLIDFSTSSDVKIHTCLPGTTRICILHRVFYSQSNVSTHIFPKNQTDIRIGSDTWLRKTDSIIEDFDTDLYRALGEPQNLEIMNVDMRTLLIPRELVHGDFTNNYLHTFSVAPGSIEPKLTYLDLGRNMISNLTNITELVNLETLYLFRNDLETLETSVFKNLTKLQYLNLHFNSIERIVGDQLPQSLTYLGLYYNHLKTLDFSCLRLPSLEMLDLERNGLESIEVSVLRLAMPNVKMVRIGGNPFSQETLRAIADTLQRNNISYRDDGDEMSCHYDEELVEGFCMERRTNNKGWIKATFLSLLTVVVAIVFILMARWVFLMMNK